MNKLYDNIRAAMTSLFANKTRALLTTIGIGIGIASVIILISLGASVQDYVNRQFASAGSDLVFIFPVATLGGSYANGPNNFFSASLTQKDLTLVEDPFNVPNVAAVVPITTITTTVDYGSNVARTEVDGATPNIFDVLNRKLASGRLFDQDDLNSNARVAVLGQTTVKNLFPLDTNPIGETIKMNDIPFRVIGTMVKYGNSFGMDQDNLILIPITTSQTHLRSLRSVSGDVPLDAIYLKAQIPEAVDNIVQTTTTLLHHEHKIKPGKQNDFDVSSEKDLLGSFTAVIAVLTIFLSIIGGISLLVGGIGVMNIMLVTVTERTREIGLRKAVGARRRDVLSQFLVEAIVLCFVGGFAGLLVALLGVTGIGLAVPDLKASISLSSIVLAVSVTTLIGLFFGIYPASRAAKLSPIAALRTE